MLNESLEYLNLASGKVVVDATVGLAGHALKIMERILPDGKLICLDRDEKSLLLAKEKLKDFAHNCEFAYANFSDMDKALENLNIKKVDAMLFDLGMSSTQLDDPARGFSFQGEGPLDMRLDINNCVSAYDLVNNLDEDELSQILWNFGQERWHNRIARAITWVRQKHPISSTKELSEIISRAIPGKFRYQKIHPATRSFQAIRIAVNRELESLEIALKKAPNLLAERGRIVVISFHSLEDRIVKHEFRDFDNQGILKILTAKPLVAQEAEILGNPRSRSAKLRSAERLQDEA